MWPLPLVGDILDIERTIQLAIAPAFLLTGIMSALNTLTTRLGRLIDRERAIRAGAEPLPGEMRRLARRARAAHRAIVGCVLAALLLCALIVTSFAGPLFGLRTGTALAVLLIAALLALMLALTLFLEEVRLASRYLPGDEA